MLLLNILSYFKHKTHYYHSPKWYHPQPQTNERTLSNDPSADSTYHLLALNHLASLPSFED